MQGPHLVHAAEGSMQHIGFRNHPKQNEHTFSESQQALELNSYSSLGAQGNDMR